MRTQPKPLAFLLLAAAMFGCAGEPDDENTGSVEAVPPASESIDRTEEMALGDSDKALRDDYCCALKKDNVTKGCFNIRATKVVAKTSCAAAAAGTKYNGHALRSVSPRRATSRRFIASHCNSRA